MEIIGFCAEVVQAAAPEPEMYLRQTVAATVHLEVAAVLDGGTEYKGELGVTV